MFFYYTKAYIYSGYLYRGRAALRRYPNGMDGWWGGMNRASDFRQKEVINVTDGRRLGFVSDVELDLDTGRIDAIVLPGVGRLFGLLGKENEFIIPWEKISKIGEDIILVDLDERFMRKYFD